VPRNPDCRLCPLGGTVLNTCVWGEWWGDVEYTGPAVMVVGINPGGREDAEGRPFIGPSGQLLKEALRQAGVKRAYLTNAFKCFAEPDMAHARACAGYLEEEIADVKPVFILALGNVAVQRLLGRGTVGQVSGKETWAAKYEAWVLPAFHPAAILRDRGRENAWRADIHRFGRLVRGDLEPPPNTPPVRVDLVSTGGHLRALDTALRTEPAFTYDFETNVVPGWWHKDFTVYTIAFSFTGQEAICLPIAHPDVDATWTEHVVRWMRERAQPLMEESGIRRTVHNGMFDDLAWFRQTGRLSRPTFDTMLALQLLDENAPKSLKWAGRAHLGWPDWDINAKKYHSLADLYPYNGYDAAATFLLQQILADRLQDEPVLLRYFLKLEMPKLRALQRMVARGIYVDRSAAARLMRKAWRERDAADARLPDGLNPASPRQVAAWLYETLKLPVIKTGKQHPSTDEATIKSLALNYPGARAILDARRPRKKITTYFRPINHMTKDSFDGRLHPDMRTTSVETGRLAGFFHTTPRDTSVRPVFTAPEGMILIQADYRQIEARLCAWMACGRPENWDGMPTNTMLGMFFGGMDIYIDFAARALRKHTNDVTKEERQIMGKVPVLAQLYGISPQGLREYAWKAFEIAWSEAQATALWTLFRQRYPEFPAWHRLAEAKLVRRGYTQTPIGRIRRLPSAQSYQKDAIRAGINAEPQSLASDITQDSLIALDALGARVVGDIHDALLIEVRRDRGRRAVEVIRQTMLDAPTRLRALGLWLPDGLIDVEITAGPWGLGKEIKQSKISTP
jgi:uracil-DNA glycosylase family 4